jgi:hypothetical protein
VAYRVAHASENELRYEVAVPLHLKMDKLTKAIKKLDENDTVRRLG